MSSGRRRASLGAWLRIGVAAASLGVFTAGAAAPLLESAGRAGTASLCRRALSGACHQKPERAFTIAGAPMALCTRCTAIYAAIPPALLALAAAWRRPSTRRGMLAAAAALAPMAVDGFFQTLDIYDAPALRAVTGALGGAAIALVWHVLFTKPPGKDAVRELSYA
ncbi:MAG: DUF2085 domain-containing protein [Acidobacteriota bacterium]|nr:MAG: DUF2085 domain-containing protein [Acidobacteriota bacterium]